jgi:hypothetical protein
MRLRGWPRAPRRLSKARKGHPTTLNGSAEAPFAHSTYRWIHLPAVRPGQSSIPTSQRASGHRPVPQAVRRGGADHSPPMRDADIQQQARRPAGAHHLESPGVEVPGRRPRHEGMLPASLNFRRPAPPCRRLRARTAGRQRTRLSRLVPRLCRRGSKSLTFMARETRDREPKGTKAIS